MNLFNLFSSRGTSLQYNLRENNTKTIDQMIKSLAKADWKCKVVGNIIYMKHEKVLTPNEILLTGTLIGMVEMGEKFR